MRATVLLLAMGLVAAMVVGCRNTPPPRIQVPTESQGNPYTTHERDPAKPLPPSATQQSLQMPQPGSIAEPAPIPPAVSQAYLDAYDRVGRPRLLVLIDHPTQPERSLVPGDYDLLERLMRESLSAGGQVAIVPSTMAYQRLSAQQVRDAISGRGSALADAGAAVHADVLVDLRVTPAGEQTQITASARNTRDGSQLTTVSTTIAPTAPRRQIDYTARLLGEKVVDALANAWDRMARQGTTQPATQPGQT